MEYCFTHSCLLFYSSTNYKYAEEVAKDEILAAKGIAGYEPPAWIQKAKEAVDRGIAIDQFMAIKNVFDQLKPMVDGGAKENP